MKNTTNGVFPRHFFYSSFVRTKKVKFYEDFENDRYFPHNGFYLFLM